MVNFTTLNCTAPPASVEEMQESRNLSYWLELDDAPFPDMLEAGLQLMVRPDPTDFMLLTESVGPNPSLVQIQVYSKDLSEISFHIRTFPRAHTLTLC